MTAWLAFALLAAGMVVSAAPDRQFRSGIAVVRVDALVTDGRRPVSGLTASQFELRDSGVPQTVTDLQYEELPLNVLCVLDVSGSVAGPMLEHLRRAYLSVVDGLRAGDRAALITLASKALLRAPLTADRARLRSLADQLVSGGSTSLYDAVFAALALREEDSGRTLLLLLSDGRDTSSWLTAQKVVAAARRTDVVIYPVTVGATMPIERVAGRNRLEPPAEQTAAEQFLDALSDDTGGRVVPAADEGRLAETLTAILKEFRERYVLSYTPTGVPAGGWHPIEVRVKGRGLTVRARRGYAGK